MLSAWRMLYCLINWYYRTIRHNLIRFSHFDVAFPERDAALVAVLFDAADDHFDASPLLASPIFAARK